MPHLCVNWPLDVPTRCIHGPREDISTLVSRPQDAASTFTDPEMKLSGIQLALPVASLTSRWHLQLLTLQDALSRGILALSGPPRFHRLMVCLQLWEAVLRYVRGLWLSAYIVRCIHSLWIATSDDRRPLKCLLWLNLWESCFSLPGACGTKMPLFVVATSRCFLRCSQNSRYLLHPKILSYGLNTCSHRFRDDPPRDVYKNWAFLFKRSSSCLHQMQSVLKMLLLWLGGLAMYPAGAFADSETPLGLHRHCEDPCRCLQAQRKSPLQMSVETKRPPTDVLGQWEAPMYWDIPCRCSHAQTFPVQTFACTKIPFRYLPIMLLPYHICRHIHMCLRIRSSLQPLVYPFLQGLCDWTSWG